MSPSAWRWASEDRQSLTVPGHVAAGVEEVKRRSGVDLVGLMRECLSWKPSNRPSFEDLSTELKRVLGEFEEKAEEAECGVEESKEN